MPSNQELNHQDPEISDVSESRESVPELGITNETAKSIGLLRVMAMLALVGGAGGCISGAGLSESQMDELKRKIGAPYLGPHRKGAAHCFTGDDDVEMKRKAIDENLKVSGLKEGEVENRRAALGVGGKWTVCVNSVKKETADAFKDELLEKIGAKYDGPQKGGESFVAFASGSTEKKARNKAKDKIRGTFPRFKVTAFEIKEISKNLYAVAMRGEKTEKVEAVKRHKERHERLVDSKYGTVHVWHPEFTGNIENLPIVVCLHGYSSNMNADFFWNSYGQLKDQFKKSGVEALFIAPDVAKDFQESLKEMLLWKNRRKEYKNLKGLIELVKGQTGLNSKGEITVMGHSGAYMSMMNWTADDLRDDSDKNGIDIKNLVLLDSMPYREGGRNYFHRWAARKGNRIIVVSSGVQAGSKARNRGFARRYSIPRLRSLPKKPTPELCSAKVIYFETPYGHRQIVDNKKVIPRALRMLHCKK